MSLVSSYIYCTDRKWYKNLVYNGPDREWFICFDDNDPVEIVIKQSSKLKPTEILKNLGVPFTSLFKKPLYCSRVFGDNWEFSEAICYFMNVENKAFPTPRHGDTFDEVFDKKPSRDGVYYGFNF